VNQIFNSILPLPSNGEAPSAQCLVSTKRSQYDTIPDAELLVELGKRISNKKNYLEVFANTEPDFDPFDDIFNYSKIKEYSQEPSPREVGENGWLDLPQPLRTDMESAGKGEKKMWPDVEFVDVELD